MNSISALFVGSWALPISFQVLRYDLSIEEIELMVLFVCFCFHLKNGHFILFPAINL